MLPYKLEHRAYRLILPNLHCVLRFVSKLKSKKMKKITAIGIISLFFISSLFSQSDEAKSVGFEYPTVAMEVYSPDSIKVELESLIKQIRETQHTLICS